MSGWLGDIGEFVTGRRGGVRNLRDIERGIVNVERIFDRVENFDERREINNNRADRGVYRSREQLERAHDRYEGHNGGGYHRGGFASGYGGHGPQRFGGSQYGNGQSDGDPRIAATREFVYAMSDAMKARPGSQDRASALLRAKEILTDPDNHLQQRDGGLQFPDIIVYLGDPQNRDTRHITFANAHGRAAGPMAAIETTAESVVGLKIGSPLMEREIQILEAAPTRPTATVAVGRGAPAPDGAVLIAAAATQDPDGVPVMTNAAVITPAAATPAAATPAAAAPAATAPDAPTASDVAVAVAAMADGTSTKDQIITFEEATIAKLKAYKETSKDPNIDRALNILKADGKINESEYKVYQKIIEKTGVDLSSTGINVEAITDEKKLGEAMVLVQAAQQAKTSPAAEAPAAEAPAPEAPAAEAPAAPGTQNPDGTAAQKLPAAVVTPAAAAPAAATFVLPPASGELAKIHTVNKKNDHTMDTKDAPKISASQVEAIQQKLGVEVDGKWGPDTQAAFAKIAKDAGVNPNEVNFTDPKDAETVKIMAQFNTLTAAPAAAQAPAAKAPAPAPAAKAPAAQAPAPAAEVSEEIVVTASREQVMDAKTAFIARELTALDTNKDKTISGAELAAFNAPTNPDKYEPIAAGTARTGAAGFAEHIKANITFSENTTEKEKDAVYKKALTKAGVTFAADIGGDSAGTQKGVALHKPAVLVTPPAAPSALFSNNNYAQDGVYYLGLDSNLKPKELTKVGEMIEDHTSYADKANTTMAFSGETFQNIKGYNSKNKSAAIGVSEAGLHIGKNGKAHDALKTFDKNGDNIISESEASLLGKNGRTFEAVLGELTPSATPNTRLPDPPTRTV